MKLADIRRLYQIFHVMLKYGMDEIIPYQKNTRIFHYWRKSLFWVKNQHPQQPLGSRLRLALQELGPVWIKFGQMLSTRRDLFSPEIADQLALLQDQVEPFDGKLARQEIEQALNGKLENWFDQFDETALASASIAQVHTVVFNQYQHKDGQSLAGKAVIIKVIRPNIETTIRADIALMYKLARWIPLFSKDGKRLRPVEVVHEYEKTLLDELDLRSEMANAIQLKRNFKDSAMLYIPEMYSNFCFKNVIVMERVYGIQISDIQALQNNGTNMKLLAERGVQVFFTQVFRDSFFHADMHPGNIFVSYHHPQDPQYISIDFGIVGSLNREDKRYLAENFVAFFNRDYQRVAELHINSGWIPADSDLWAFEQAIRKVCDPIFAKPLSEISFGHVLLNLFNTARQFNMEIQPQLVLLQKTLLYIEGIGRQLYPQLDLWQTAKPFLENWLNEQVGIRSVYTKIKQKLPYFREHFTEFPEILVDALQQQKLISKQLNNINDTITHQTQKNLKKILAVILSVTLFLGTLWQYSTISYLLSHFLLALAIIIGIWAVATK